MRVPPRVAAATAIMIIVASCGSSTKNSGVSQSTNATNPAPTVVTASSTSLASTSTTGGATTIATDAPTPAATAALPTTPATPVPNLPDACSLLLPAEVAGWLGGTGTATPGAPGSSACRFGDGSQSVSVTVGSSVSGPTGPVTAAQFAAEMQQFSGTVVPGVGDSAYLAKANSFIAFLVGTTEVVVQYSTVLIGQDAVDGLTAVAKAAAGRA